MVYKRSEFGYNQFRMGKKSLIPKGPEKGYISVNSDDSELIKAQTMMVDGKKVRNRYRTHKDPTMNIIDGKP